MRERDFRINKTIYKYRTMLTPHVDKYEDIEFPKGSTLYLNLFGNGLITGDSREFLVGNTVYSSIIHKYSNIMSMGHSNVDRSITDTSVLTLGKKTEVRFKYFEKDNYPRKIDKKILLINDYGILNKSYKYNDQKFKVYNIWFNHFSTVIDNVLNDTRDDHPLVFIELKIPNVLPSIITLNKYVLKEPTDEMLEYLPNGIYLTILDIWRLLTPEVTEKSILSRIPNDKIQDVILILTLDQHVVYLPLHTIKSAVEEYNIKTKIKTHTYTKIRRVFYILLNKLQEAVLVDQKVMTSGIEEGLKSKDLIPDIEIDKDETTVKDISDLMNIEDIDKEESIPTNTEVINDDIIEDDINVMIENINKRELENDVPTYNTISDVLNETIVKTDIISTELEKLKKNKRITTAKYNKLTEIIKKRNTITSPYGGKKLKEMLEVVPNEDVLDVAETSIGDKKSVIDKDMLTNTTGAMDAVYIDKVFKKHMLKVIYSIESPDLIVTDHKIESKSSILGETEQHTIVIEGTSGRQTTIKQVIDKVSPDGTLFITGNEYKMRKQKGDIPIKKIDRSTVGLTSYYGKLFIAKAVGTANNCGIKIMRKLLNMHNEGIHVTELVTLGTDQFDSNSTPLYGKISREIKQVVIDGYYMFFDYNNRKEILDKSDYTLKEVESNDLLLLGKYRSDILCIDSRDKVYRYNGKTYNEVGTLYDIMHIPKDTLPIEFATLSIFKKQVPVVIMLGYYMGLEQLFRLLSVGHTFHQDKKSVKITPDQYSVRFSNGVLVINRDDSIGDMLFGGLISIKKLLLNLSYGTLDNKELYLMLFNAMGLDLNYITKIKIFETLFIDPITLEVLIKLKKPKTFKGLLIEASRMLLDDNYKNPKDKTSYLYKGYERIPGIMYNQLVKAVETNMNQSHFTGNSKLKIAPHATQTIIGSDSTTVLMDDINPIAYLKLHEDVSYLGFGGRSKETITATDRSTHPSEIGLVSEAHKDSGDVGMSAFMSAVPMINSSSGINTVTDKLKWVNVLSTTSMLMPFTLHDDAKRMNFSSAQYSHVIPSEGMNIPYIITGYEAVIINRAGEKFGICAKYDGVVNSVTKSNVAVTYFINKIYLSGVDDKLLETLMVNGRKQEYSVIKIPVIKDVTMCPVLGKDDVIIISNNSSEIATLIKDKYETNVISIGKTTGGDLHLNLNPNSNDIFKYIKKLKNKSINKSYSINSWTTKENSGMCFRHQMVAFVNKGDSIDKDDILIYNKSFFGRSIFSKKDLLFRTSRDIITALREDVETYEDSCALSSRLVKNMGISTTVVKSTIIDNNTSIFDMVKIGDKTEISTKLLTISSLDTGGEKVDKETLETLKKIAGMNPIAGVKGVVSDVYIYYNVEYEELSKNLRKYIDESDIRIKHKFNNKDFTGKVNSSYSVDGKSLQPGSIQIKIYIDTVEDMGVADKIIFSGQLKMTPGEIFDYEYRTEDGTNIDAKISVLSLKKRIVEAAKIYGTTARVIHRGTEIACDMYFNDK